ncbi:MAG: SDR family NAD(P)-dependent oxidoreductase [Candidatus Aminicenantes bacterium]|jgi:amino acid adenylation domain-containing protein
MAHANSNNSSTGLEIAVIGMSGRFPGAKNLDRFWDNLKKGIEAVTFFHEDELKESGFAPGLTRKPNFTKARAYLEDIEYFDSVFFNYTPKEAELMDPQIRLFHECSWEALENAGYDPESYQGLIGIYAGYTPNSFWRAKDLLQEKSASRRFETRSINSFFFSTLICYKLNLKGPGVSIHTACSTSLTAIHMACRALLTGEADITLAGGVNINLPQESGYLYQEGMINSADGHCRPFDARASGTLPGNGIGIVVLKRLVKAAADRDHIYAVIKGTAINNDGSQRAGYTAPGVEGQAAVIKAALEMAEVEPESISYIETHGTGTSLGDPIEIEALQKAFNTKKRKFCRIGSIKANIGHLDAASGAAGFIKTVLALYHRLIPPAVNFETPNPKIGLENTPFTINTKPVQWKNDHYPLRAGVSSFGIGGTNVHVILEEAPEIRRQKTEDRRQSQGRGGVSPPGQLREYQLILLSAKTETALDKMADNLARFLKNNPGIKLADVAYTLQVGRKAFKHRTKITAANRQETIEKLENKNFQSFFVKRKQPPLVFMFSGQGVQYVDMGLELYQTEPLFRQQMDRCIEILKPLTNYDIKEILYPLNRSDRSYTSYKSHKSYINQTEIAQPLLFMFEYALARLLSKWGIIPYAMMGHSIGEYVAACISGVFSLEHALKLVVLRGKLMQTAPAGSMVSVSLSEEEVKPLTGKDLDLAAVNAPRRCVVSGPGPGIKAFAAQMKEKGHETTVLHTSHAYHSSMMDGILEEYENHVNQVTLNQPTIPYISNVTGTRITAAQARDPRYWATHIRKTVRFSDGIRTLLEKSSPIFIEIGPGKALTTLVRQHTDPDKQTEKPVLALNLVRHPRETISDSYFLTEQLGCLWMWGGQVDWHQYHAHENEKKQRIPLPTYPFQRLRYDVKQDLGQIIKKIALGAEASGDPEPMPMDRWFYVPSWKRKDLPTNRNSSPVPNCCRLVFQDQCGVALKLIRQLKENHQPLLVIKPGTAFEITGSDKTGIPTITINPGQPDHYRRLFDEIGQRNIVPEEILHCWSITADNPGPAGKEQVEQALDLGFYSLLNIARTHTQLEFAHENPLRLIVISSHLWEVTGTEDLHPGKAALIGAVGVIPKEYPHINCRTIDIVLPTAGTPEEKQLLHQLTAELSITPPYPDTAVALRDFHRWVQTFEPVPMAKPGNRLPLLKKGGVYLVTGGFGGIGFVLARNLAETLQARIILTSRRTPGPHEQQKVQELESLGTEVLVCSADVSHQQRMEEVFRQVLQRFGTINGIIHAAGTADYAGLIQRRDREQSEAVLAPKVTGTLVLDQLLTAMNIQADFFILCSSLSSIIAPWGQVAYAAANAFLDAFAQQQQKKPGNPTITVSIDWDSWQQVGMAVQAVERLADSMESTTYHTRPLNHPIFDKQLTARTNNEEIFISYFHAEKDWFINEHRIHGSPTLPGVAYLEFLRAAFALLNNEQDDQHPHNNMMEIKNLFFSQPLMMQNQEKKEVRTIFKKQGQGFRCRVISRSLPGQEQWQEHAVGTLLPLTPNPPTRHPLKEIQKKCGGNWITLDKLKETPVPNTHFIQVGPRWQNMKQGMAAGNRGLIQLELPGQFSTDLQSYWLHPALMDSATSFLVNRFQDRQNYLPFSLQRVRTGIHTHLPGKIYSYAQLAKENQPEPGSPKKTLELNITIMDEQGMELVDIEGFILLPLPPDRSLAPGPARQEQEPGTHPLLQYAIYPAEGIEAVKRILANPYPQVLVSTRDFLQRLEKSQKFQFTPPQEDAAPRTAAAPLHPRPSLSTRYVAPTDTTQQTLVNIWQEFFGIQQPGILDDFFELGGDSLKALTLLNRLHKEFNLEIPVTDIFNHPTIRGISSIIEKKQHSPSRGLQGRIQYAPIEPVEKKEYYPVSSAQKRLYILHQLEPGNTSYNLPHPLSLQGETNRQRLEETAGKLIARHESLRTSFIIVNDEPVQKIHETVDFKIRQTTRDFQQESLVDFVHPFDLSKAPLLRLEKIKTTQDNDILFLDIHHIITDAASQFLLQKEFESLYAGEELPPLKLRYKDFSQWQNSEPQRALLKSQGAYWIQSFSDDLPILDIPTDYPRPLMQNFAGNWVNFALSIKKSDILKNIAKENDLTLYMILLAIFNVLFAKLSGQEDIIIGTPMVSARRHNDLQPVIGMMVNTLAMRNYPAPGKPFNQFLKEVKQRTLAAYENQDYPFEDLVENISLERDTSRNPLFDVLLDLLLTGEEESGEFSPVEIPEFPPYQHRKMTSPFDMTFVVGERSKQVIFTLQYSTQLFIPATIERIIQYLGNIILSLPGNTAREIGEIEYISKQEKESILEFCWGESDITADASTLHRMLEKQAGAAAHRIALVDADRHLGYGELNRRSHQLAHLLAEKGVGIDTVVAVMLERSLEMVIAIWGVLKAGGAYLPIDPQYPQQRILAMLHDSKASPLLTRVQTLEHFSYTALKNLEINEEKLVLTPVQPQIKDLDRLPKPDRTLIDYKKYHQNIGFAMAKHTISLQTTRGCPFNCAYCQKIWPKTHVVRSAGSVMDEIQCCYDSGIKRFVFIDDVFNLDKKNSSQILENISKKNLDIQLFFPNGLRGDILDKNFIDLMIEAGTVNIAMALESASPRLQKLISKNLHLEKFEENLRYIIETYPRLILEMELMLGFPTEIEKEALMTLEFLERFKWVHFPNLHILKIYPNTDMFKLAIKHGISERLIQQSAVLAYHELPGTLPYAKAFVKECQARLLNGYILSKERLLKVLPYQIKTLTGDELVQKYNSYLPMEIKSFSDILHYAGITGKELGNTGILPANHRAAPDFTRAARQYFPVKERSVNPLKILLLDLSLFFSRQVQHRHMLYDMIEEPLGLMYLLTFLNHRLNGRVWGKIAKSRIDFDSYDELKNLVKEFKPGLIGIRTLSFYKEFFHQTVLQMRQWGIDVPIVAGGPYATSDYRLILQDTNIDLVVRGEGEITLAQLVEKMIENHNQLPGEQVLKQIPGIAFLKDKYKQKTRENTRHILLLDDLCASRQEKYTRENPGDNSKPGDSCYVIYTSGSTGKPKGVILEHRNLINLIRFQTGYTNLDCTRMMQFAALSFDASFHEIFSALLSGGTLYLPDQETRANIPALFNFIRQNMIKTVFLPMSLLKLIFSENEFIRLIPGCIRHIQTAGEQVMVNNQFREYLKKAGVYLHNHYGPSETHVAATLTLNPLKDIPELPPIGRPVTNTAIYLLDKNQQPVPLGVPGELYIGGSQVGRGYLNKPELTAERFVLAHSSWLIAGRVVKEETVDFPMSYQLSAMNCIYQTGDLAKWLPDRNIEFLGRIDLQVKIRGFRVEPGEIESRLSNHDDIKQVVVTTGNEENKTKYLCAYIVSNRELDPAELRGYLSVDLPAYMIPAYFVFLDKIPLTPSGKIDRKRLPPPGWVGRGKYTPPTNRTQEKLLDIWAEVLGIEKKNIGIDGNFFELGGHSLRATIMIARIHKKFNVQLPLAEIFKTPRIRNLAQCIIKLQEVIYEDIKPVEKREFYVQSSAQKRLFFLNRLEGGTTYNIPYVIEVNARVQKDRLEKVLLTLIARHEALRTSFHTVNREPVQKIHPRVEFEIEYYDIKGVEVKVKVEEERSSVLEGTRGLAPLSIPAARSSQLAASAIKDFIRPFDLSQAPLLRARIAAQTDNRYLLLLDIHHIISDGTSLEILTDEFIRIYENNIPLPLEIQYKDFTQWQNKQFEKGKIKQQLDYWLNLLAGKIPRLDLPTDYPRPATADFQGNYYQFNLDTHNTKKFRALSEEMGATLYMNLLTVLNVLFFNYTGQEDIILGTGTMGRPHTALQQVIGMFVNSLVMRNTPKKEKTYWELFKEVKENSINAFDNQDVQFEELVDRLDVKRDPARNPIFDVMFVVQNFERSKRSINDMKITRGDIQFRTSKFDLFLQASEVDEQLSFNLEYATSLFKPKTIEIIAGHLQEIIQQVVENKYIKLKDILITRELIDPETPNLENETGDFQF